MENWTYLALLLGVSWASGINLYLTVVFLGLAGRFEWLVLPGQLEIVSHPLIIGLALVLFIIEFFADKIPVVDTTWDAIHTLIRPFGGAILGYLSLAEGSAFAQTAAALVGGTIALDSHFIKASSRVAINTSPEPFTNVAASVTEDVSVLGAFWLMIHHPWIMVGFVFAFLGLSIWLIPKLFRFFQHLFKFIFNGSKAADSNKVSVKSSQQN